MGYDRDSAIKYAEAHWNIPCDDGIFWLTDERISIAQKRKDLKAPAADGWQPLFVDDGGGGEKAVFRRTVGAKVEEKLINPWEGLADCAHFLSKCLSAGGAKTDERGVRSLVETLQGRRDTKTLCEKVSRSVAQRVIDTGIYKKGDMIGYFNVDPAGDYGRGNSYTHSTMFAGKIDVAKIGGVTCHTISRFPPKSWVNDSWWLHDGYLYTLIHFSVDDPVPPANKAAELAGWWQVQYMTRIEYCLIGMDGQARYTLKRPAKSAAPIHAVSNSAHWFMDLAGMITFVWRNGSVETWSAGPPGKGFNTMVNGLITGTAVKLIA